MDTLLPQLKTGQTAKIKSLKCGFGLQRKIISLGIRIGREIKVISSQPFRGPIVVEVDGMRIALGRGIANKIIVK